MLRSIVDNVTLPHLGEVSAGGVVSRRERRRAEELDARARRARHAADGAG